MALHVAAWAGRTAAIPALVHGAVCAVAAVAAASRSTTLGAADPSQAVAIPAEHSIGIVAGKTRDWRAFAPDPTAVTEEWQVLALDADKTRMLSVA